MSSGIVEIMKRAALDAADNAKLCELRYGVVMSVAPLSVQVTTQFTIPASMLVVPRHLTNYAVDIALSGWETEIAPPEEDPNDPSSAPSEPTEELVEEHKHSILGIKKIVIHNALKVGEKVALIREQGGKSYLIIDRV